MSNPKYPKYDNYDAIEVSKTKDIPMDYAGIMGVPISFLTKYNPEQFEIIKFRKGNDEKDLIVNGKCPYFRILIRNKRFVNPKYPKYDNYDAINIDRVKDIPKDYPGIMGVPISFLTKYNPDQFEIIGIDRYIENNPNYGKRFKINNREIYARILIRNKKLQGE